MKHYSCLMASIGFFVAACQLSQLTVSKAINIVKSPLRVKIHQLSWVLKAKFSSHFCMKNQARGTAITKARVSHLIKSLLRRAKISLVPAPFTLRRPISLIRRFIDNTVRVNKPMHAITMASKEKRFKAFVRFWSS